MKNNIHLLCLALLALLGLGSCDKNETPLYDTEYSALNIWCGSAQTPVDSVTYNYSYSMGEDSVMFYARVSGMPADYDRTFTLEVVGGTVEEAEGSYRIETYTIPAGEIQVECPIYFDTSLLKDNNLFSEESGDGLLVFRLAPNDTFAEGVEELSTLNIVLRNYLAQPDNWYEASNPYYALSNFFGDYSKEKYQFMIDELGMMEFKVNRNATVPYDEENNEISYNYANYLRERLSNALDEYNATHDTPLQDSLGNRITF